MLNNEEKTFLYEKGYKNLSTIDQDEFEFIYNYEKHIDKISTNTFQYKTVEWNGELHYNILLEILSGLYFVKTETSNNNFSEYCIFPILGSESKEIKINKLPTIVIKKIKKQCELYLTSDTIPLKYSDCFDKLKIYKGKLKWKWNGDLLIKEDVILLKEIIELLINNLKKES